MKGIQSGILGALSICLAACGEKPEAAQGQPTESPPASQPAPAESDPRSALGDELTALMRQFGKTVATVKDEASWLAAKEELAGNKARILAITAELKSLPKPTEAQKNAFMEMMMKNEDDLEKALGDKDTFIGNLPQEIGRELMQAAGDFSSTMGLAQYALYGIESP